MQTFEEFNNMNKYTGFKGGFCVKNDDSEEPPPSDAQLIFGTPISINYWIKNGKLDVTHVNFLVIDEEDAILDKHSTLYPSTSVLLNKLLQQNVSIWIFLINIQEFNY